MWTKPWCISSLLASTSYELQKTAKLGTRNIFKHHLKSCQTLNPIQRPFKCLFRFQPKQHLWTKPVPTWNPYPLLVHTQFEIVQNTNFCLIRAFGQTPGRHPSHLLPLLFNRRAWALSCKPTLARIRAEVASPVPRHLLASLRRFLTEWRRKVTASHLLFHHCSPPISSSPCDARAPPT
jgi:hypothetical protein